MTLHIGFTGTRHGMTEQQLAMMPHILARTLAGFISLPVTAHHGDCEGADAQFRKLCRAREFRIVGHPPSNQTHRAHCSFDVLCPLKSYLDRNYDIVTAADYMIATPAENEEQTRGGTWSTVRLTRKFKKPLALCLPDGRIEWEQLP